ncbi:uncharacterized protein LOC135632889 [Musa acuminata AAA Group]|uniref:uncharacterized protein LOC135632889 n=1 Tax=Musa acuminata AAA Group TaxID=214697 RepID=UPI0031D11397
MQLRYCSDLDVSGCSSSTCLYGGQYGHKYYTIGFFAQDKLTLTSADVIPNFPLGCGQRNRGFFGKLAGLLGLGRERTSLVMQADRKCGGVFAYCLLSKSSSAGYLTFGRDGYPASYYLDLIAVTVGGRVFHVLLHPLCSPNTERSLSPAWSSAGCLRPHTPRSGRLSGRGCRAPRRTAGIEPKLKTLSKRTGPFRTDFLLHPYAYAASERAEDCGLRVPSRGWQRQMQQRRRRGTGWIVLRPLLEAVLNN